MRELAAERNAVKDAVEGLRLTPVLFELGARPHPPRELYAAYLGQSHVFVGIYAEEYGWVAPGMDRSGVEDELVLGGALPQLLYVREPAPRRDPRLEVLLDRIRAESAASYRHFADAEELRRLVADDLAVLVSERFHATRDPVPTFDRATLPLPVGSLVGRDEDVAAVAGLLGSQGFRLVTLVGPGGVGKSRLAFEAARVSGARFADGVVAALLGPLRDADVVVPTIAGALGLADDSARSALDVVETVLQDRCLLLVLDNFEHVLDAAPEVAHILERCASVEVLATSRQPLGLRGEHVFSVHPLALPDERAGREEALGAAAVRMFEVRAAAAAPGFAVDEHNAQAVVEICRRLDGLPLALELAASRTRLFTPADLVERLDEGSNALGRGSRDAPGRQQTLDAAVRWSYDLLDQAGKQAFRRLGVFRGGWTPEAAAAITNADPVTSEALVDQSLVVWERTLVGPRLSMLETIRDHAAGLLRRSGEHEAICARHWSYFADVAQAHYEGPPEDRHDTVERLRPDLDNFRAALERAVTAADDDAVRLAGNLGLFWTDVGLITEGRASIERALAAAPDAPVRWRARALLMLSWLASDQGSYRDAEAPAAESLDLARRAHDRVGVGLALRILGNAALNQGHLDRALELLQESVSELGAAGDETSRIRALGTLARCLSSRGDFADAAPLYEEACSYDRQHRHDDHLAVMLVHLGIDQRALGRIDDALHSLTEATAVLRRLDMPHNLAWALTEVARIHALNGDLDDLVMELSECLAVFTRMDDRHGLALTYEIGAALALATARHEAGARLLGSATRLRDETGAALVPGEVDDVARDADRLRRALGDEEYEDALAAGRRLSEADALSLLDRILAEERASSLATAS